MTTKELPRMTSAQRAALFYVRRHQTEDFGVIVSVPTGEALLRRGWAKQAPRRRYARTTGLCLQLTDDGRNITLVIEGKI